MIRESTNAWSTKVEHSSTCGTELMWSYMNPTKKETDTSSVRGHFPLLFLWIWETWRGTTPPLAWDKWTTGGTSATEEASELHPESLRATYLSAPLWAIHILACTCLWWARTLVKPPPPLTSPARPLQTPHNPLEQRAEAWGSPFRQGDRQGRSPKKKAAVMRERKKEVCTHVPFVLLTTSSLVFHGRVSTMES